MENRIGFIGLGNMGINMAKNLIAAGYHLQVHNRTMSKADELDQAHITKCPTPAEAAAGVPIIITMLSEDEIVTETVTGKDGILETFPKGSVHISMSTISPETAEALEKAHKDKGSIYISAPVFGRPEAAAAKKLWICTSGDSQAKKIAKPVLDNLGQGTVDFGEKIGSANVIKISGNFMILSSLEMMAECFTLAEKFGIERTKASEFFTSTLFTAPLFQNYGKLLANKQYEPVGFKAKLGLKDARLAVKLSQLSETPMPLANLAHNRLLTAIAKGGGDKDWVEAFGKGVSDDAGI
jgi:3-hydroxyisobutyrate dehydrogenase-like beta-hydroxyacid dehydrogenase